MISPIAHLLEKIGEIPTHVINTAIKRELHVSGKKGEYISVDAPAQYYQVSFHGAEHYICYDGHFYYIDIHGGWQKWIV